MLWVFSSVVIHRLFGSSPIQGNNMARHWVKKASRVLEILLSSIPIYPVRPFICCFVVSCEMRCKGTKKSEKRRVKGDYFTVANIF